MHTIATVSLVTRSSGHDRKTGTVADIFQFIFAMFIMFLSGGFLKIYLKAFGVP